MADAGLQAGCRQAFLFDGHTAFFLRHRGLPIETACFTPALKTHRLYASLHDTSTYLVSNWLPTALFAVAVPVLYTLWTRMYV